MTATIPESVLAEANVEVVFVPAVAGIATPTITVTEIDAGQRISCYLPSGWDGVTATQNKGQQTRFCTAESWEVLGTIQRSIADLTYTYVPQLLGTPGGDGNEVYEALAGGTEGFLVVRYGKSAPSAFAANDIVDIIPAVCGPQNKNATGADDSAPLTVTQSIGQSGPTIPDVKVVAGS